MDRRIERTKKSIKDAFALLISQKSLNEITITDIADAANINRKTFYSYYAGIYEVIDEIEDEIACIFEDAVKNEDMHDFLENPQKVLHSLNEVLNKNLDFYANLLRMKGTSSLNTKIVGKMKKQIVHAFLVDYPNKDPEKVEIIINFIFSGIVEAFCIWFTTDRKIPLKELEETLENFVFHGIKGMVKV